eukprot:TRINITY_DN25222_c0_g1_i1.p1 TRINITY_DN25222_c0_g1~~TRINITY_DN25222_c0_g1_i1.p1  ORF type:complete len:725 (+),score=130.50 TRINITY_DN25222_c0_g1_i1:33-2207(+)
MDLESGHRQASAPLLERAQSLPDLPAPFGVRLPPPSGKLWGWLFCISSETLNGALGYFFLYALPTEDWAPFFKASALILVVLIEMVIWYAIALGLIGVFCREQREWLNGNFRYAYFVSGVLPGLVALGMPQGIPSWMLADQEHLNAWPAWRSGIVIGIFLVAAVWVMFGWRPSQLPSELYEQQGAAVSAVVLGGCSLCVLLMAVSYTALPSLWYYSFLLQPWVKVLNLQRFNIVPWKWLQDPEQHRLLWLLAALEVWYAMQLLAMQYSKYLQSWGAQQRVDKMINFALAHPYSVELEKSFGAERAPSRLSMASFVREVSRPFIKQSTRSLNDIKSKRESLVKYRREKYKAKWLLDAQATFMLHVSRDDLLNTSCDALVESTTIGDLLAWKLVVSYKGESGIDAGGLTRDWFDSFAKELAEGAEDVSGSSLFVLAPDKTLMPRPGGKRSEETDRARLKKFVAVGRFMGIAIIQEQPIPLSFSALVCKFILNMKITIADVQKFDDDFYRQRLEPLLQEGGVAILNDMLGFPLTFESAGSDFRPEPVELKPGGAQIEVTEANKQEYMKLLADDYLGGPAKKELQALLQGFWDILPRALLHSIELTPADLSIMISGIATVDVEDMKNNVEMTADTPEQAEWFWQVTAEMSGEQRCQLLHFTTGSSRLPPSGFQGLEPKLSIRLGVGSEGSLPISHTCGNQLEIPAYKTKQDLKDKLSLAIRSEGFGFA